MALLLLIKLATKLKLIILLANTKSFQNYFNIWLFLSIIKTFLLAEIVITLHWQFQRHFSIHILEICCELIERQTAFQQQQSKHLPRPESHDSSLRRRQPDREGTNWSLLKPCYLSLQLLVYVTSSSTLLFAAVVVIVLLFLWCRRVWHPADRKLLQPEAPLTAQVP